MPLKTSDPEQMDVTYLSKVVPCYCWSTGQCRLDKSLACDASSLERTGAFLDTWLKCKMWSVRCLEQQWNLATYVILLSRKCAQHTPSLTHTPIYMCVCVCIQRNSYSKRALTSTHTFACAFACAVPYSCACAFTMHWNLHWHVITCACELMFVQLCRYTCAACADMSKHACPLSYHYIDCRLNLQNMHIHIRCHVRMPMCMCIYLHIHASM